MFNSFFVTVKEFFQHLISNFNFPVINHFWNLSKQIVLALLIITLKLVT